jgi:hypothetical protein
MRTLSLIFMIAGGLFAQDQPPSQGQFFPPPEQKSPPPKPFVFLHPLKLAPTPPKPLSAPYPTNFTIQSIPPLNPAPAVASRCAVPLLEMKTPAATDAIARSFPPNAMTDKMAVAPPVPACSANPSAEKAP